MTVTVHPALRDLRSQITVIEPDPDTTAVQPTWHHAEILAHTPAGDRYRHLSLHAPSVARLTRPGQFVMVTAARDGEHAPVLPRPMAIYRKDTDTGTVEIVYGVVGSGTKRLSSFGPGERLLTIGPLGRGFQLHPATHRVLLIGRGIGTCSLTTVAQDLADTPTEVLAVTSGRDERALIGGPLYREFGATTLYEVTDAARTSDVDALHRRLTTDLDDDPPGRILTCGSDRLAELSRTLGQRWTADVQVSLEAHMACGLGYCHGCASGSRNGPVESPLVCKDGPVFRLGDALAQAAG
ncbi:dihydroorotate oxidase electron transfer subunit [Streptomyces nigra]|uniref:iron-sulfur cluster-binding protein n=1 Tax=Streptomyces nigra TaxID=1827580 RepID=UPI0036B27838